MRAIARKGGAAMAAMLMLAGLPGAASAGAVTIECSFEVRPSERVLLPQKVRIEWPADYEPARIIDERIRAEGRKFALSEIPVETQKRITFAWTSQLRRFPELDPIFDSGNKPFRIAWKITMNKAAGKKEPGAVKALLTATPLVPYSPLQSGGAQARGTCRTVSGR